MQTLCKITKAYRDDLESTVAAEVCRLLMKSLNSIAIIYSVTSTHFRLSNPACLEMYFEYFLFIGVTGTQNDYLCIKLMYLCFVDFFSNIVCINKKTKWKIPFRASCHFRATIADHVCGITIDTSSKIRKHCPKVRMLSVVSQYCYLKRRADVWSLQELFVYR